MTNTFGHIEIEMHPSAKCFCTLGQQWYQADMTVLMVPGDEVPDYCEVQQFIREEMDGRNLIIEEAVTVLFNHLINEYEPVSLMVEARVGPGLHFPVAVRRVKGGDEE